MKIALDANSKSITADADAPQEAFCPTCNSKVSLRKRCLMGGGYTYYWRHQNQRGFKCRQSNAQDENH